MNGLWVIWTADAATSEGSPLLACRHDVGPTGGLNSVECVCLRIFVGSGTISEIKTGGCHGLRFVPGGMSAGISEGVKTGEYQPPHRPRPAHRQK